jgi:hypothetical protein
MRARRILGLAGFALSWCGAGSAWAEPARPRAVGVAPEWTPEVEEQRAAHHLRSWFEMGAGLGLGAGAYWIFQDRNVADWDNPRPEERFQAQAWILDNNSLFVNYMGHPLTGGLSYSFARANHYGVASSFGYSFLTSFLWEFVLEFKEKVSINDVIVTPGAGLPIGEFVHKLGLYLNTGRDSSVLVDAARWALGTGVALDRHLDGRGAPNVGRRDNLGFSRAIWHEFRAVYGVASIETPQEPSYARYRLELGGRLVTLPRYLQAHQFGRAFYRADISDFSLGVEASRYGAGVLAHADTIIVGYHAQAMQRASPGRVPEGVALTVGSGLGWDYLKSAANRYRQVEQALAQPEPPMKYHVPMRQEQWSGFHLPGVAVDLHAAGNWADFSVSGRLAPSFGSLGAPAFYDWTAANPTEKSKHIVHRQGYFYGWGMASSLVARAALGPLRGGFELRYASYASQDGWDRQPQQLTVDVPVQGSALLYSATLGVQPPGTGVSVQGELGVRRFRSQVGGFERTARAVERGISARWTF